MRTCFALRHVPFESLGLLAPLIAERGFDVQVLDVPVVELPKSAMENAELVIVLGGPISAYEEHLYPFLKDELTLLERRLRDDKPTMGICLGAQLMARALGARVYPGSEKEIGWAKLQLAEAGRNHALAAVEEQRVLHWHGDTFELPEGATLLASTKVTPHQAFSWKNAGLALQFHLEVTARELEAWYVAHTVELSRWGKIGIPELRAAGRGFAPSLEPHAIRALRAMLDGLLA
jgi:GMP synthase (glutamine-hydrolysing)